MNTELIATPLISPANAPLPNSETSDAAFDPALGYKPLMLGPVAIGFPVVQAALSAAIAIGRCGCIARRLGASYTLCEVMLDQFVLGHSHRKKTASAGSARHRRRASGRRAVDGGRPAQILARRRCDWSRPAST